ncbi:MAG: ABC transporter substrate-binding protein [Thermodesulfobacteriota bacterium]
MDKRIVRLLITIPCLLATGIFFAREAAAWVGAVDFRGKEIRLQRPAERIICLMESALTGLYMLNAEKRIVGISQNVYLGNTFHYYAKMDKRIRNKELPAPGNWDFVNIESVVALKPDLVVIWSEQTESIAALERHRIPVFGVFIRKKEDIFREMHGLGELTGTAPRAGYLITYVREEMNRLQGRISSIPENEKPKIYYMWAQGNLETSCGESTVNDLIETAGGRNVCRDIPKEHLVVNLEKILAWNPEMIVMWHNERKDPGDILQDSQWARIQAVQNKRVHEFPEVFLCDLWTLKFFYASLLTAKWSHPGRFEDVDLDREKKRMIKVLYDGKMDGI